jgi:hypothetical protein
MQLNLLDLTMPNMPILEVERCYSRPISYQTTKPILLNHHYLHRNCQTILNVGMYVDNILAGVCCFGVTIASVSDAICGKEFRYNVVDLNRLYVYDWAGKNSESWLIGQGFKWLRKLHPKRFILVSYASISDGHTGIVYQATNWLYTGQSATGLQFTIDDTLYTARSIMAKYGTVSLPKLKCIFGNRIIQEKTTPKNRYIYFLGSKFQKRKLRKLLKWDVLPYPKERQ